MVTVFASKKGSNGFSHYIASADDNGIEPLGLMPLPQSSMIPLGYTVQTLMGEAVQGSLHLSDEIHRHLWSDQSSEVPHQHRYVCKAWLRSHTSGSWFNSSIAYQLGLCISRSFLHRNGSPSPHLCGLYIGLGCRIISHQHHRQSGAMFCSSAATFTSCGSPPSLYHHELTHNNPSKD